MITFDTLIDPALSFRNEAGQALECLLGRQLTERERLALLAKRVAQLEASC